jgi:hypothetical protein
MKPALIQTNIFSSEGRQKELGVNAAVLEKLTEHTDPYTSDHLINFLRVLKVNNVNMSDELSSLKWFGFNDVAKTESIHPSLRRFLLDFLIGAQTNRQRWLL